MKILLKFHHATKLLLFFLLFGASALAQTTATVTVLGGEQSSGGVWDSGDVTIEVSGTNGGSLSRTVPYGQFSTPASVAAGLAALISRECYGVASAKADGATITFHLRYAAAAPINITAGTPHWDSVHFTNASFGFSAQQTVTPTQVTLTGNAGEFVAPNTQISLSASIAQTGATGVIEFYDRGALLGTSVISGSQANYTTPALATGAHELYAKYTGDSNYAGSTSNTVYATAADHSGPAVDTPVYKYSITDSSNNSGYAANGNITAYSDSVMGQWNLGYDSLNRLSSGNAQTGPIPSQVGSYFCWSYDSFGNRLSQVVANQGFSVSNGSSCQSNGVLSQTWTNYDGNNRITGTNAPNYSAAPVYDNGGNITNDGRNLYLYDGEGRVCAVQAPSAVPGLPATMQQYLYDAEGRRVAKGTISSWNCNADSNGFVQTTAYVDGPDGGQMTEMSVAANGTMAWVHTNVTASGKLIATYQNDNGGTSPESGTLHFALNDWLGTKRVQTSYDGASDNSWVSLPFGEVPPAPPGGSYATPDATEQHFTGKERDTESGLDYFGARYYGSNMGRMMSPDPGWFLQADPSNPQTWNQYSYVLNNPLRFIDPTGMECVWEDGSYDSYSDTDTGAADGQGNHSACTMKGGTWIDHSYFAQNGMADWSSQGNKDLAGMTVISATTNTHAPNPFLDGVAGAISFPGQRVTAANDPDNLRVMALARGVTKSTNCAVNAFKHNAVGMALDGIGMVPGAGEAKLIADVANATVQSANSAAQGDGTGAGLSMGDLVTKPIIAAVKQDGAKAIPVMGEIYSGFLLARDVWNASGDLTKCW